MGSVRRTIWTEWQGLNKLNSYAQPTLSERLPVDQKTLGSD